MLLSQKDQTKYPNSKKFNINEQNVDGDTAILVCVQTNELSVRVNLYCTDRDKRTALLMATRSSWSMLKDKFMTYI